MNRDPIRRPDDGEPDPPTQFGFTFPAGDPALAGAVVNVTVHLPGPVRQLPGDAAITAGPDTVALAPEQGPREIVVPEKDPHVSFAPPRVHREEAETGEPTRRRRNPRTAEPELTEEHRAPVIVTVPENVPTREHDLSDEPVVDEPEPDPAEETDSEPEPPLRPEVLTTEALGDEEWYRRGRRGAPEHLSAQTRGSALWHPNRSRRSTWLPPELGSAAAISPWAPGEAPQNDADTALPRHRAHHDGAHVGSYPILHGFPDAEPLPRVNPEHSADSPEEAHSASAAEASSAPQEVSIAPEPVEVSEAPQDFTVPVVLPEVSTEPREDILATAPSTVRSDLHSVPIPTIPQEEDDTLIEPETPEATLTEEAALTEDALETSTHPAHAGAPEESVTVLPSEEPALAATTVLPTTPAEQPEYPEYSLPATEVLAASPLASARGIDPNPADTAPTERPSGVLLLERPAEPSTVRPAEPSTVRPAPGPLRADRRESAAIAAAPAPAPASSPWFFPALDGLRGIAIMAVLLFHTSLTSRGLFVGVDVFFVVSGFLIILSLLKELDRTGKIRVVAFTVRRIKRIFPPLLIMLGITMIITWRFGTLQEAQTTATKGLWSLIQMSNWYQLASQDAYWSMTGTVQPLAHMWSLSVTEQFYLVWPLFMLLMWWVCRKNPVACAIVLGLLLVGTAAIDPLLWDDHNADRLYLGTDSRLVSVVAGALAGCIVFIIVRSRLRRAAENPAATVAAPSSTSRVLVSLVGIISLLGLLGCAWMATSYTDAWLYNGGFAAIAILAAVLTASLCFPGNVLVGLFSFSPFVAFGKVSYTVYLIHLPIYWVVQKLTPGISPLWLFVAGLIASWLIGLILHYALAEPWRLAKWTWKKGIPIFLVGVLTVVALGFGLPAQREAQMRSTTADATGALSVAPGHAGGRPVVLTVGDSVSRDFATMLSEHGSNAFAVIDGGVGGCGIMEPEQVRSTGGYIWEEQTQCQSWPETVGASLKSEHPDFVVVHSTWDAADQRIDGQWINSCDPGYRKRYDAQLGKLLGMVEKDAPGAQVLLSNDRPTNGILTDPTAMSCYDDVIGEVIEQHKNVHLLDLAASLCTGDECRTKTPENKPIFLEDNVHYTDAGMSAMAPWLEQQIAAVQKKAGAQPTPTGGTEAVPSKKAEQEPGTPAPSQKEKK